MSKKHMKGAAVQANIFVEFCGKQKYIRHSSNGVTCSYLSHKIYIGPRNYLIRRTSYTSILSIILPQELAKTVNCCARSLTHLVSGMEFSAQAPRGGARCENSAKDTNLCEDIKNLRFLRF